MNFSDIDNLTLDRIVEYRIRVRGILETDVRDWVGGEILTNEDGTTEILGCYDQASLHGVLSWIYSRGIPLISIIPVMDKVVGDTGKPL